MMAVATAGHPTESVDPTGKCQRTEGESMPMLFMLPRLSPYAPPLDGVYSPPLPSPPPPPPGSAPVVEVGSFLWRLSGASGDFSMIGLGDIVLPALAIAFARRVDLALAREHHGAAVRCGYFSWAVVGYGLGLAVTLAANTYGWTFNDVKGQPALLYLVPGVIGALLLRSLLQQSTRELWDGLSLPQQLGGVVWCDGCKTGLQGSESVWSNARKNLDYCPACYSKLPFDKQALLTMVAVYLRCGIEPPGGASEPALI